MATAKKGSSKGKGKGPEGTEPKASPEPKATAKTAMATPAAKKKAAAEEAVDLGIPGFKDSIRLNSEAQALFVKAAVVAVVGLGVAAGIGATKGDGMKSFLHSYLTAYMVACAIGLGTLYWVTLQHLVNAHWSVVLRRLGELFANSAPVLFVLALPMIIPTIMGSDVLYDWASHEKVHASHLLHHKAPYLNPTFFAIRMVFYFGFFTLLAAFWLKTSLKQDQAKEAATGLMLKMRAAAGPSMIVFALSLTFMAIDLVMSLDATWFSTIFGVYYFASCVLCAQATLILAARWLQAKGRLQTVSVEHYHDVGKLMFAFTIFWAYIGFGQFMLIWYANIPEETFWYKRRFADEWGTMAWALLFLHFVVPFFGMLSRHVKRNKAMISFWAVWVLVVVYLDMYWLVMPELEEGSSFGLVDPLCLLGVLGAVVASVAFRARNINLMPVGDPRLERSLAFENI